MRGNSIQVAPGNTVQLLNTRLDAPQAMSLFLSSAVVAQSANWPQNAVAYAVITWGCEQAIHTAEVDLVAGSTVSIHADSVRVAVVYTAGDGPTLLISASLAPGLSEHDAPTRTIFRGGLNAGAGSGRLEIPPFARRIICYQSGTATNLTTVEFYTTTSAFEGTARTTTSGPGNGISNSLLTLAPDRLVRVVNNSLVAGTYTLAAILGL